MNANKRSITVDRKDRAAVAWLADFIASRDVLVQNLRPGVLNDDPRHGRGAHPSPGGGHRHDPAAPELDFELMGLPVSFDGRRPGIRRPPPRLGQHNDEVIAPRGGRA
jgi:crotonobetainyl-CoA:carnitine CoA-transferase CaiB-like acyl-CoA transferase